MRLVPPVTIDQLNDEWDRDCDIDLSMPDIDIELLKLSSLHAKYCRIRSHHKQVSIALEDKYRTMKEVLSTLEKYGLTQYQGMPVTMRTAQ